MKRPASNLRQDLLPSLAKIGQALKDLALTPGEVRTALTERQIRLRRRKLEKQQSAMVR